MKAEREIGYRVGEIHPTSTDPTKELADNIRTALRLAADHDTAALKLRRHAGRLLAELRSQQPTGAHWHNCVDLDQRSTDLLIELGCSARPAGHAR